MKEKKVFLKPYGYSEYLIMVYTILRRNPHKNCVEIPIRVKNIQKKL